MNARPTVKDVYSILGGIETDIDWLTTSMADLKKEFKEHLSAHRSTWLWLVPTILMLVNSVLLVVQLFGG